MKKNNALLPHVYIIVGPTASGKTEFSYTIARQMQGEIINGDSVQAVSPLSIGTAKPDYKKSDIPHHLFDTISTPTTMTVVEYRQQVIDTVQDLIKRNKVPLIVGGSFFYIKSLFFPPVRHVSVMSNKEAKERVAALPKEGRWKLLNTIDAQRAACIHPNDEYRIMRALEVWFLTGTQPSRLQPPFKPPFRATILCLSPERPVLFERINARTEKMIFEGGWIEEAERIMQDPLWRSFIEQKGFIGYPELFSWIEKGKKEEDIRSIITTIQQQTRDYAKRQEVFWKGFFKLISDHDTEGLISLHEARTDKEGYRILSLTQS